MPNISINTVPLASLTAHNCSNSPNYNKANFPKLFTGTTFKDLSLTPYPVDSNLRDDGLTPAAPMNICKDSLRKLMPPNWKGKLVKFWQAYVYDGTSHPEAGYHNNDPAVLERQVADSRGFDVNTVDLYGPNFKGAGNDFVMDTIATACPKYGQTFYATFDQQCLTAPANKSPQASTRMPLSPTLTTLRTDTLAIRHMSTIREGRSWASGASAGRSKGFRLTGRP